MDKRKGKPLSEPPKPISKEQRKNGINNVLLMPEYNPMQKKSIIQLIKNIPLVEPKQ